MSEGIVTEDILFALACLSVPTQSEFVHRLHIKINSVQSVFFLFLSVRESGYTSLSSLTRLAVSLKLSSVGEKALGRSFFEGFAGGANGDGSGAEESSLFPSGFSSFICKKK